MPWAHALVLLACAVSASGCNADREAGPHRSPVAAEQRGRAQALLAQYQCGSCHHIPGVPSSLAGAGPSLSGFGRRSYIAGQVPNTPESLQRWLQDPPALVPGATMPRLGVSERDARDIAGYLLSLQ